jgi:processive 1,2-diacylglycerol beta-glucosyltransferase
MLLGVSEPGPILILTASAGAGHNTAARALEAAFRRHAPDRAVEVIDVLSLSNQLFRKLYADGYLGLVRHAPLAMGLLYDALDRRSNGVNERWRVAFQNLSMRSTTRFLRRRRSALIVNTHFLPAETVAGMRRRGQLDCPQVTVTTDFETHRMWVQPPTERYYTATEEGKVYLTTWGVDPASVLVTGIPVRPQFEQPVDRDAVRIKHQLDPGRPLVLLLCGGFGVGPTGELLQELIEMPGDAQIAVIAGRNEPLRRKLEAQIANALAGAGIRPALDARRGQGSRTSNRPETSAGAVPAEFSPGRHASRPVRIVGYTDAMHEWMRAADVAVTKPGGLTVAESLVCGLPLVVVSPIPGQEARNSDYLLEHGAGIKVNNVRLLGYRVSRLLADAPALERLRAAALNCARPAAADKIAADALGLLECADAGVGGAPS